MNRYQQFKENNQQMYNDLPLHFAFSGAQFGEIVTKLGIEGNPKDHLLSIGYGGFILKKDEERYKNVTEAITKATYDLYIGNDLELQKQMWEYELANHEYGYTYELDDTLNAVGLTLDELKTEEKYKNLYAMLQEALKGY